MLVNHQRSLVLTVLAMAMAATPVTASASTVADLRIPTVARGYRAPKLPTATLKLAGITAQPFVGIKLHDAIAMALLKNPNLAIEMEKLKIAGYQVTAAKGAFDVHFQLAPSITHLTDAPTNAFFAGPNFSPIIQNQQKLAGSLGALLPSGESLTVGLSQTKTDDNTFINAFNPSFETSLDAAFVQPLFRGAGTNPAKAQLELAVLGSRAQRAATLSQVSLSIANVESSYWNLVAAWRNVAIANSALNQARAQEGSVRRLVAHGAAAPVEITEAHSQAEAFRASLESALQGVATLQNTLKSEILDDPNDPIWMANLVPTSPARSLPTISNLPKLVAQALKERPEIAQSKATVAAAAVALRNAKNGILPKIDLSLGYQSNGYAGIPTNVNPFGSGPPTPVPGYLAGAMAQSYHNLWGGRFPIYDAQLTYSTTFGHHQSHAALSSAEANVRIASIQARNLIQQIVFENRNALQAYQSAIARLAATRSARIAAARVYQSEVRKFKNGASTTFLVLQRQVQLEQAMGAELQAQSDLNISIVDIEQATGTILSQNHVELKNIGTGALHE